MIQGSAEVPVPDVRGETVILQIGALLETVKAEAKVPLPPSGLVTVTVLASAEALWSMVMSTRRVSELIQVTSSMPMPSPKLTVAPSWKFWPVMVTVRLAPLVPVAGETESMRGSPKSPRFTDTEAETDPEVTVTSA
jgi:hypothetical protein